MANFNLTSGADAFSGGAADDIFYAFADRTTTGQAKSTLNAADMINGGGGFNTLVLEGDYQNDVDSPVNHLLRGTISNIQRLVLTGEFRDTDYSGNPIALDLSKIGGLQEVRAEDATDFGLNQTFGALSPRLSNVSAAHKIVFASDGLAALFLNYTSAVTAAHLYMEGQSIGAAQIKGAQLTTLSVHFAGTASQSDLLILSSAATADNPNLTTLNLDTAAGARGVVFNGSIVPLLSAIFAVTDPESTLSGPLGVDKLSSVTVTGTGGAWVDLGTNTANVTFTGAGGDDAVLVDAANTNASDHFDGKGGTDIFALSFLSIAPSALVLTPGTPGYAAINASQNFEQVGFIGDFQRKIVVDASKIANQHTFIVGQSSEFQNLQDVDKVEYQLLHFAALQTSTFTLKHAVTPQGRMIGTGTVSLHGDDVLDIGPLLTQMLGEDYLDPIGGTALFDTTSVYAVLTLTGAFNAVVSGAATWKDSAGTARGVTIDASNLAGTLTTTNATALADRITGTANADTLNGGAGADTVTGGAGNDTYVNPNGDTIVEAAGGGTDTVQSDTTYTLGGQVERLILTGTGTVNGTGNGLANLMIGNDKANILTGADGNDTLNGGGGADTINGGSGADRLLPGLQRDKVFAGSDTAADTVVFSQMGESTGVTRDVLTGFDFNAEDTIDIPVVPVAFAASLGSGALSTATFNQDLSAAITAARLPVGRAMLFNPSSGDLAQPGMVYLIVDANGIVGYQANQDWVFQLENHTGTLDTGDFI